MYKLNIIYNYLQRINRNISFTLIARSCFLNTP